MKMFGRIMDAQLLRDFLSSTSGDVYRVGKAKGKQAMLTLYGRRVADRHHAAALGARPLSTMWR